MKTAIIILHFGKLSVTQACIKSILKVEKEYQNIIIINNDQIALKPTDFPSKGKITIVNNKRNVGFAAGVNIGIRYALKKGSSMVLLLNNDTILHEALLPKLTNDLKEDEKIGIVAPVLEFSKKNKTLYDLGGYINIFGKTRHENVKKIPFEILRIPHYVSGCCMLIRKEVFEKVGYFDERFFLYYEDVDFCLRVSKGGFAVVVDPKVVLYHSLSKSAGKGSKVAWYHQTKSAMLFGKKYYKYTWKRLFNIAFIIAQSLLFLKKNPHNGVAAITGFWDSLIGK